MTSIDSNSAPRVFVSYSHDSSEHMAWVLQLATRLRTNGVDVVLDQWDMELGSNLTLFMESGLSSSQRVLVVSSMAYVEKANARRGGTGYESNILSADMYNGDIHKERIIPVIRNNAADPAAGGVAGLLPTFVGIPLFVDMRDDTAYEEKYDDLLRAIHSVPKAPKPALGENPFRPRTGELYFPPSQLAERYVSPALTGEVTFPYENNSGTYVVGGGDAIFHTNWSTAGMGSIHVYRANGSFVALAPRVGNFDNIGDALKYDFSSTNRTAHVGDAVIYRNKNDYFLALLIDSVTTRDGGQDFGELHFRYRIQNDRSSKFGHELDHRTTT